MSHREPPRDTLPTGTVLGRVKLLAPLGSGAMGTVFRARHQELGRDVAVKVLHKHVAADRELVGRFRAEAVAAARIAHPNVVEVLEFWHDEYGNAHLVMELLDGEPLGDFIARTAGKDQPDVPASLGILWQLAGALEAAHRAGVVHRDVKPANVFLVRGAGVKLVDFGFAKTVAGGPLQALTATGEIVGTPLYMAPEYARGKPCTPATDVYAVGCLAFELFTGRPPFVSRKAVDVLLSHIEAPIPRVSAARALAGAAALDAFIARAMAKAPGERFASAAEMQADLGRLRAALGLPGDLETTLPSHVASQLHTRLSVPDLPAVPRTGDSARAWLFVAAVMALSALALVVWALVARWPFGRYFAPQ